MPNTGERRFKKGQIICRPGEMEMNMYNILYGSVGVYTDYGRPEQVEVVTLREGDFFNVISFLESCHALEAYGDKERLQAEHGEWYAQHSKMVHYINAMFPYLMGKPEDGEAHNGK